MAVATSVSARVERLRGRLEQPLLVTSLVNVRYLTGFASSNAAVLVEPDRVRLFTDFRYANAARAVHGVEFVETSRALPTSLAAILDGRIAFEADHMTYADYQTIASGEVDLVPTSGLVAELREHKDEDELENIRRAAAIADQAYRLLAQERFTGRTEREMAWRMDSLMRELGGERPAFETIVSSAENSARPHGRPTDRVIGANETVIVDAGTVYGGYCSDCTRTFATGELPARLRRAYDAVLDAQQFALELIRTGASGRDVDARTRARIDATEFAGMFGHGLGHGVGIEVHETPTLRPERDDLLGESSVVTVEPGIYVEGEGGIRIEDLVVVRQGGPEILTPFTKELVTVA
jgi:Xaa-Pro aminopeptidase/Xaa-Pro dipeptidase